MTYWSSPLGSSNSIFGYWAAIGLAILAPNWILREVLDTVLRMRPKVELVVSGSGEFGAIGGVEEPDQAAGYFGKRRSIAARLHPVQFAVYWLTLLTVLGEASFRVTSIGQ